MNHTAALQGEALYALLEQARDLLNDYDEDRLTAIQPHERIAAVVELLHQQPLAPATAEELEQLHDFWLKLEQPVTANAALQQHRERVLAAEGSTREEAAIRLNLSDIQSRMSFDPASARTLLLPTAQAIDACFRESDDDRYWQSWNWFAHQLQAWDAAADALQLQRQQERFNPELAEDAAYLDSILLVRTAQLKHKAGHNAQVLALVQSAINTLRDAPADQQVDFDRWVTLAEHVLPLAPQSLPTLLMSCEHKLAQLESPSPSQAVKAHRQVKITRLQAQACAQVGQLEAALQLAPKGCVSLVDDNSDSFSAMYLGWLVQAGRMHEAANLALESVLHSRSVSAVAAFNLAKEQLPHDAAHATTWALVLAISQIDEDMRRLLVQQGRAPHPANFYLDMVRAAQPQHPALAVIEGMHLAKQRQLVQALPLLEIGIGQHPEMADSNKLLALWAARFAALPLEDALGRPFPEAYGAHWCYAVGVVLDDVDDLAPLMGSKEKVPAQAVRELLVVRYYEEGLRRFEHFWATGEGRYDDANLHVYSMLCNNLAIKYRFMGRYDEAAELHHKGLGSSPFAEHYNSLIWCSIGMDNDEQTVTDAERLWHYAQEHGYSRHEPTRYLPCVAFALYRLDRDGEISIWMERLDEWFNELDTDVKRNVRRNYLSALMSLLDFFSSTRPELVLPRLREHQEEVIALKDCYALRRLASAMEAYPELLQECVALYKQAHSYLVPEDSENEQKTVLSDIKRAERKLVERDAQSSAATSDCKPWWRFW